MGVLYTLADNSVEAYVKLLGSAAIDRTQFRNKTLFVTNSAISSDTITDRSSVYAHIAQIYKNTS